MRGHFRPKLKLLAGPALIVGAGLAALCVPAAAHWRASLALQPVRPVQSAANALNGTYAGVVHLDWSLPGTYTDALATPRPGPTPAPDLGVIDLGLRLSQSGDDVTGHVDLGFTQVFTKEQEVDGLAVGPAVTGTVSGTGVSLTSSTSNRTTAGMSLRGRFALTGQFDPDQEDVLSGEYRDTIWGYGPQPFTVIGRFSLQLVRTVNAGPEGRQSAAFLPMALNQ